MLINYNEKWVSESAHREITALVSYNDNFDSKMLLLSGNYTAILSRREIKSKGGVGPTPRSNPRSQNKQCNFTWKLINMQSLVKLIGEHPKCLLKVLHHINP